MSNKRRLLYCALVAVVLLAALAIYNRCSSRAEVVKVERDTVVIHDTVPYYHPAPKDSAIVKYVTRYLPVVKNDTINHFVEVSKMVNSVSFRENSVTEHFADTSNMIAVEVPITSKHYQSQDYDAWVSGYEPSLDSIKVYQRTEYITERVTLSKPPNKWELDAFASIDYRSRHETYMPSAGIELKYKPSRLQVGVRAGVSRMDKAESFVGAVVRYRIF